MRWLRSLLGSAPRSPSVTVKPGTPVEGIRLAPAPLAPRQRKRRYSTEVVGESFRQPVLEALAGGYRPEGYELAALAQLVCDDTNPHDPLAVAVLIAGHQVGNLPRDVARTYRADLESLGIVATPTLCDALIVGGFIRRGSDRERGDFGVRLDLAWPLTLAQDPGRDR